MSLSCTLDVLVLYFRYHTLYLSILLLYLGVLLLYFRRSSPVLGCDNLPHTRRTLVSPVGRVEDEYTVGDDPDDVDDGLAEGGEVLRVRPALEGGVEQGTVRTMVHHSTPNLRI